MYPVISSDPVNLAAMFNAVAAWETVVEVVESTAPFKYVVSVPPLLT
jgi:hypothetical protein